MKKMEPLAVVNGKISNDVRKVRVSDYKDILLVGHSVLIEGKKYIVADKTPSKCIVMDLNGNIKSFYYKYIDYMYFTVETSKDSEIIEFIKHIKIKGFDVVDYEPLNGFRCKDGSLHSYSYLLNKYLKQRNFKKGLVA